MARRRAPAPVVRFSTGGGRLIEFHGRGGSGTSYAAGDLMKGQRLVTYSILFFIFSFLVLLFASVLWIGPDNRTAGW